MKPKESEPVAAESRPDWITKDFVMGKFDPTLHDQFNLIDSQYADRKGLYLQKDAYRDFERMWDAAYKEDIHLLIRSATRNFEYQKGLWEKKWRGVTILSDGTKASTIPDVVARAKKILLYSSMPGTSRHHWGTDIDLISFNNAFFEHGEGKKIYDWLQLNAANYGFCQPYTDKSSGRTGYEEEKWHWTYTPISKQLTEYWQKNVSNKDLVGFEGSEVADSVDMLGKYVLGIDTKCL